jgi:glycerol kinase
MAQQTADLVDALAADGVPAARLRVDGGMVANDWLCQDLADSLGLVVERPRVIETTALGAAMLAGVGAGLFADLAEAAAMAAPDRSFVPALADEARDAFEKSYFEFHLAKEGGSMTRVAERTGLERTHLYRKLKQLGVDLSRNKRGAG